MAGEIARRNSLLIRPIVSAHRLAGQRRFRRSGTIARRSPSVRQRQAFTLIELLVVISIITLLMAILLPTLQRARNQGRAVACQSNLRQWGVAFSMYANDNDGELSNLNNILWPHWLRSYYSDSNDLLFCPMAKHIKNRPDNQIMSANMYMSEIAGGKYEPWEFRFNNSPLSVHFLGSYGTNTRMIPALSRIEDHYNINIRGPINNMPLLLDCVLMWGHPSPSDSPPEYEGLLFGPAFSGKMKHFCINRHNGGINGLFLDFSVRKVGLKELWTLKWHSISHTPGPWTRTGGVLPEDWPQWMRSFKDY